MLIMSQDTLIKYVSRELNILFNVYFSGPYYRFRTWKDMYDYPWSRWVDCGSAVLDRGYIIPAYAILFILSGHFFPINVVKGM